MFTTVVLIFANLDFHLLLGFDCVQKEITVLGAHYSIRMLSSRLVVMLKEHKWVWFFDCGWHVLESSLFSIFTIFEARKWHLILEIRLLRVGTIWLFNRAWLVITFPDYTHYFLLFRLLTWIVFKWIALFETLNFYCLWVHCTISLPLNLTGLYSLMVFQLVHHLYNQF